MVKRYPVLIIYSMFSLLLHYCSLICDWHALRQPSQWEIILKRSSIAKSRNMGTESLSVVFLPLFVQLHTPVRSSVIPHYTFSACRHQQHL